MKKIISIDSLTRIIPKLKTKGKKIVLCHGVFDLLHIGHIKHFKEAKNLGDILVITLTPDRFVNKGPNKPAFDEKLRLEAIAALDVVDFVALNISPTAVALIQKLIPDIYCKGTDYKNHRNDISNQIRNEIKAVRKVGGKVVYTDVITFSSSKLLNQYSDIYTDQQKSLINRIKKKYQFSQIEDSIKAFKKAKVLIIGETIIDQYIFCETLGTFQDPVGIFTGLEITSDILVNLVNLLKLIPCQ